MMVKYKKKNFQKKLKSFQTKIENQLDFLAINQIGMVLNKLNINVL
jgi:hypothetical protein